MSELLYKGQDFLYFWRIIQNNINFYFHFIIIMHQNFFFLIIFWSYYINFKLIDPLNQKILFIYLSILPLVISMEHIYYYFMQNSLFIFSLTNSTFQYTICIFYQFYNTPYFLFNYYNGYCLYFILKLKN